MTYKKFTLVDEYLISYDGDYFDLHKPSDIRSLVNVIGYVTDENEQLKSDVLYWRTLAQNLAKGNKIGEFEMMDKEVTVDLNELDINIQKEIIFKSDLNKWIESKMSYYQRMMEKTDGSNYVNAKGHLDMLIRLKEWLEQRWCGMTEKKYRVHDWVKFQYSEIGEYIDENHTDRPLRNDEIVELLNEQHEEIERLKENVDELLSVDIEEELVKENEQLKKVIDEADDLIKSHLSAYYNHRWENICEHLGVDLND